MRRIRSNKGNLYPSGEPKTAGHKDLHYDHVCFACKGMILKKESQMAIPEYDSNGIFLGTKYYHWRCVPHEESPCCKGEIKITTFTQSGKIHSGEKSCMTCNKILETLDQEKKVWVKR